MGKLKNKQGYIQVNNKNHPRSFYGKVAEHILVMEKHIGRYLPEGTVVHHINRIKNDNRIENLLLLRNRDDHLSLHRAMKSGNAAIVKAFEYWSKEFMEKLKLGLPAEECFKGNLVLVNTNSRDIQEQGSLTDNVKSDLEKDLFNLLKFERTKIAAQKKVPAYIIFNDRTLNEMSKLMPTTKEQMLSISGVGQVKLKMYGFIFMSIIRNFKSNQF